MSKRAMVSCIQTGFSEVAPDLCDAIWMRALESEEIFVQEQENQKETFFERLKEKMTWRSMGVAVACVCLCLLFGIRQNEISIIMDVNPSIEILTDEGYKVKKVHPRNQDGENVLKEVNWEKNDEIQVVMEELLEEMGKQNYLKEDGGILISVSKAKEENYQVIQQTLDSCISQKLEDMQFVAVKAAFRQAKETEGRAELEKEILKKGTLDKDVVENMSVVELIEVCEKEKVSIYVPKKKTEKEKQKEEKKDDSGIKSKKNKKEKAQVNENKQKPIATETVESVKPNSQVVKKEQKVDSQKPIQEVTRPGTKENAEKTPSESETTKPEQGVMKPIEPINKEKGESTNLKPIEGVENPSKPANKEKGESGEIKPIEGVEKPAESTNKGNEESTDLKPIGGIEKPAVLPNKENGESAGLKPIEGIEKPTVSDSKKE